ncbi:MAG: hypothetical protein PHP64_05955 [Actinomycetota bacterium]|nr:hypothetical protein [Actinomycetota bacterium]
MDRLRKIADKLATGLGFEIVDVETRKGKPMVLSVTIDKSDGVNVENCADFTRLLEKAIERDSIIKENYSIEVMSPGLTRRLRTVSDFQRNKGKRILVKMKGQFSVEDTIRGFLREASEETFAVERENEVVELKYDSASMVRLDPELPW